MKDTLKKILKVLAIPLSLALIFLTYTMLWKLFDLPSTTELTEMIEETFLTYGLWVVLVASFIEGLLLLGQYFPGGFVIFLGVIASRGDPLRAAQVVLIVSIAFYAAYYVNYLLGKYGWYRLFLKFGLKNSLDNTQTKVSKDAFFAVMANYWDTNLASITATAAGILNVPLPKFLAYSALGIAIWNTVWGFLVYFVGEFILDNQNSIGFGILGIWSVIIIARVFFWEKIKARFLTRTPVAMK